MEIPDKEVGNREGKGIMFIRSPLSISMSFANMFYEQKEHRGL